MATPCRKCREKDAEIRRLHETLRGALAQPHPSPVPYPVYPQPIYPQPHWPQCPTYPQPWITWCSGDTTGTSIPSVFSIDPPLPDAEWAFTQET